MLIISGSMAKKYGKMPKHLWDHQIAGSSPNHHVEGWEGGLHQRARDTHQGFPDPPPPMLSTRQGLRCGRPTSSSSSPTVHSRGTAGGTGAEARLTAPPPPLVDASPMSLPRPAGLGRGQPVTWLETLLGSM